MRYLVLPGILVGVLSAIVAADRYETKLEISSAAPEARGPQGQRWTNSIGMDFVEIPPGNFTMGSSSSETTPHERPAHPVTISKPFLMAATEVTQAQWKAVFGSNPANFEGDELPIEQVSWSDAQEFIREMNAKEDGAHYRLPTEAEWEYACRAGAMGYHYGDLDSIAWFDPNSGGATHPVGQKQPNAWGLYDMLGNVYEWCEDWKGAYPEGSVTDPGGPSTGSFRVIRGGSWMVHANRTKAHFRDFFPPEQHRTDIGFRVVAVAENP
jgi:formylglycine-generating enzyme required for sulfatase activity